VESGDEFSDALDTFPVEEESVPKEQAPLVPEEPAPPVPEEQAPPVPEEQAPPVPEVPVPVVLEVPVPVVLEVPVPVPTVVAPVSAMTAYMDEYEEEVGEYPMQTVEDEENYSM